MVAEETNRVYFPPELNGVIDRYNKSTDAKERELLWNTILHNPFSKVVECIFNKYKFDYVLDDVGKERAMQMCLTHLVCNLDKYDITQNKNAFGYFSVAAKNYFIHWNNRIYKERIRSVELVNEHDDDEREAVTLITTDYKDVNLEEYIEAFAHYLKKNEGDICNSAQQVKILNYILKAMKEGIELPNVSNGNGNGKAITQFLKDLQTELGTIPQSTLSYLIRRVRAKHRQCYKRYIETGEVSFLK